MVWMGVDGCVWSLLPSTGTSGPFLRTQGWTALLVQGPRKACSRHPFSVPPQLTPSSLPLGILGVSQSSARMSWMVHSPVLEHSRGRTWGK